MSNNSKISDIKCHLCNRALGEVGFYLKRINGKGVTGIWECRPSCDIKISPDEAILQAITGEEPKEKSE